MPTFTFNRIVVSQLVGYALALLAYFHVILPAGMSAANIVAAIMLASAAVGGVLRLYHPGDPFAAIKPILASKTIVTAYVAAGFAMLALFGVVPAIDQTSVVSVAMTGATILLTLFGGTASKPVA